MGRVKDIDLALDKLAADLESERLAELAPEHDDDEIPDSDDRTS